MLGIIKRNVTKIFKHHQLMIFLLSSFFLIYLLGRNFCFLFRSFFDWNFVENQIELFFISFSRCFLNPRNNYLFPL
jgi:hypothetical protein